MNQVAVMFFGAFQDNQNLQALLDGNGWAVTFVKDVEFLRSQDCRKPALALVVMGDHALSNPADQALLFDRVCRGYRFGTVCLISNQPDKFDAEFYANFDDFIFWPCSRKELHARISRFMHDEIVHSESVHARMLEDFAAVNLLGHSKIFMRLLEFIKKIARCDASVLIEGETGTGKENAARAIHYLSDRRQNGFIPVNCGAIPDNLLESELFGHDKGAFTDAKLSQPGLVELASKGTLFLDEVDSLSLKAQAALLRFLQTHEYRPLGSRRLKHADVRIVAATNANLEEKVESGVFRRDLLFRLKVLSVAVPPLRERPEDIGLIANNLLVTYASKYNVRPKTLHPKSLDWLRRQHWPGNVRELENVLLREFLLAEGPIIRIADDDRPPGGAPAAFHKAKEAAINAFEIDYLNQVLELTSGNVTAAAKIAGKERRAFGKLIKKYNVDKRGFYDPGI